MTDSTDNIRHDEHNAPDDPATAIPDSVDTTADNTFVDETVDPDGNVDIDEGSDISNTTGIPTVKDDPYADAKPVKHMNKKVVIAIVCIAVAAACICGYGAFTAYQNCQHEQEIAAKNDTAKTTCSDFESKLSAIMETVSGDYDEGTSVQAVTDLNSLKSEVENSKDALTYSDGDTQLYDNLIETINGDTTGIQTTIVNKINEHISSLTVDTSTASKEDIQKSTDNLNAYLAEIDGNAELKDAIGEDAVSEIKNTITEKVNENTAKVDELTKAEEEAAKKAEEERKAQEQQAAATNTNTSNSGSAGYSGGSSSNSGNTAHSNGGNNYNPPSSSQESSSSTSIENSSSDDGEVDVNYRPTYEELVAQGIHVGGDTSYEALKEYYPWI